MLNTLKSKALMFGCTAFLMAASAFAQAPIVVKSFEGSGSPPSIPLNVGATTLQLVMVSGIMYVSGRERSLRAATEFIGALGANVGVGMIFREGTRTLLKFLPGWGNVICGMVAGAGTYAIGRAATVYFLEGVSLKDARRVYLSSKKRRPRAAVETLKQPRKGSKRRK